MNSPLIRSVRNYSLLLLTFILIACSGAEKTTTQEVSMIDYDTVKAQRFDTGRMWTFEDAPLDYFEETYGFRPSEEWLEKVRLSSLRFANWCSSSFVSEDGLIMTNHHCIDFISNRIQQEGENIARDGFYASTLQDERRIPSLFVDQLVLIEDVTGQIRAAESSGINEEEMDELRREKINELQEEYTSGTGLVCRVTELYSGGKYSLYGYRRYNDVRAVLFLEENMGLYGGDPDNFTYPRYNPDFAFLRVYDEDGNPMKAFNYFKWSKEGVQLDEPVFISGYPGRTSRLKTVAQLEYLRDVSYRNSSFLLNGYLDGIEEIIEKNPGRKEELESRLIYFANSAKVYKGIWEGLHDPYLMARKRAFETEFRSKVKENPELNKQYGHLWEAIKNTTEEKRKYACDLAAFSIGDRRTRPAVINVAYSMIKLAEELKLPEEQRDAAYKAESLEETINSIFPNNYDTEMETLKLGIFADYLILNLGKDHPLVKKMFNGLTGGEAAAYMLDNSEISSKEKTLDLAGKGSEAIENSNDPFLAYVKSSSENGERLESLMAELQSTEDMLENQLGRAIHEVFGTSIPSDATSTLRIIDGKLEKFEYNGTIAPSHTTFYGLYDRYYSHNKEYPWDLPERWLNYGPEFDLETPFNFVSTNDVTGGGSGSPVINKDAEIIGVAFDGNIESIFGDFIYDPSINRNISVASQGILEIVRDLLKLDRLADEIENGRIVKEKYESRK